MSTQSWGRKICEIFCIRHMVAHGEFVCHLLANSTKRYLPPSLILMKNALIKILKLPFNFKQKVDI
jgi:hypothetical protein